MSNIVKAMNGDKQAFESLIIENKSKMYKTAIVILKNDDDAYDALQEALIKMYKNIGKLESAEAFYAWSKRIIINCCYDIIYKNQKVVNINTKLMNTYEESIEDSHECEDETAKLLENLEEDLRLVSILYYYDELSIREIGEVLEIPQGTVKSRLSRAREKLYKILKEEEGENNE